MENYTTTQLLIWETMSKYGIYNLTWEISPGFYSANKADIIEKIKYKDN